MKKKYLSFAFALLFHGSLWAQSIKVTSFALDPTDLTAQHENVKDANGDMCALIKVQIVSDNVKFSGDVYGEPKHLQNEYYVYVLDGTTYLNISTESTLPTEVDFSKYSSDASSLKGGCTYILKIALPEKAPGVTFEVGVPNVPIIVGGKTYTTDEMGTLDLSLAKGSYSYTVCMQGYKKIEGVVEIDKIPVIKTIRLEKGDGLVDKGILTITYPLDAVMTIVPANSSAKAPSKSMFKTGEQVMLNGDYKVTFTKKKYQSQTMTVSVKPGDNVRRAFEGVALQVESKFQSYETAKIFKEYKKMADGGDDCAQYKVGCCYAKGVGVPQSQASAILYWTYAARQGNMDAYRMLYENDETFTGRQRWLQVLADNGDGNAMVDLAEQYESRGNWQQMSAWLKKACASNIKEKRAYYKMGELYYEGKGVPQNYSRAYKYFSIAASYGLPQAKEKLLDYQYLGLDGQEQDMKGAVEGYLKLGKDLSDDGNYKIGMYYYDQYEKNNSSMSLTFAKQYFAKLNPYTASKTVHFTTKAQSIFYTIARKLEPTTEAVFYYKLCECAGADIANIYNQLGAAYRIGKGVNVDDSKAFDYFKKSSDLGDKEGRCWLGFCYEKGVGVLRDKEKAVELYQQAEQMGSITAAGFLGTMYAQGAAGLPRNMDKAVQLWTLAGNNGKTSAMRNLIKYYQSKKNGEQVLYWSEKLRKLNSDD